MIVFFAARSHFRRFALNNDGGVDLFMFILYMEGKIGALAPQKNIKGDLCFMVSFSLQAASSWMVEWARILGEEGLQLPHPRKQMHPEDEKGFTLLMKEVFNKSPFVVSARRDHVCKSERVSKRVCAHLRCTYLYMYI